MGAAPTARSGAVTLTVDTDNNCSMARSQEELGAGAFDVLGERVRTALSERGFEEPTEPQRLAIPPIAAGEDVLVIAPTGSGKTETAMLPILDSLNRGQTGHEDGFGALYVTPLRALNRDMHQRLEWWGEVLSLDIDVRHGDTSQYQRSKQASDPPDVLVTTPETLQAMLTGETLRKGLSHVDHVVVDEVHELANAKRGAQLSIGLERLRALAGPFQRVGLSATVGKPEEIGRFLTGNRGCIIRSVDVGSRISARVLAPEIIDRDKQIAARLASDASIASHVRAIIDLVRANESTLIFVNTRQAAEALGSRFNALGENIGVHHGSLAKGARIDVEDRFKSGELDALLCTSSMELGIDVGRIDHVVQYQSPREVTRLLQRIGRAGHRVDLASKGTIVATRADDVLESAAIVEGALGGSVEPARVHRGSLDTLANQIAGIVMDESEVSGARIYEIVTGAAPFADIDPDVLREVIEELSRNRIVWLDREEDRVSRTGQTWRYFYENLSMIPDEAQFTVYDMASGEQIGTLDERFVVNFAAPGEIFIQRGEMWRIVEIDEERDRVKVVPIENPSGEVPSWIGEEIPVPFDVAQRVGGYRAAIAESLRTSGDPSTVRGVLPDTLEGTHTRELASEPIQRQLEADAPVPTDDRIVLEGGGGSIVVNACLGHRTNETIGRVLAALLGQRSGSSIGLDVDPYRIDLEVPGNIGLADVREVLTDTDPDHVATLIELSLKRSDALTFRLAQVATKFGALKSWEAGSAGAPPRRLLAALEGTPMYDEAVRELIHDELDPTRAASVLDGLQSGRIDLVEHRGRTPVGMGGRTGVAELLAPEDADASVIRTVRNRLMNDRITLCCLHCKDWTRTTTVERVDEHPECPTCQSTRIAALNPWDEETVAAIQAAEKDEEQERRTRRAYRSANLVQSHGKRAVIALAARGVGPQTAARIISNLHEDEDDFYRDLIAQERQYARTRSFWD